MKICVPYKFWEAALVCAAVDDVRFFLNGIHLNKNRIESTNGHVAYIAEFGKHEIDGNNSINGQVGFCKFEEYNGEWPDVIVGHFGPKPSSSVAKKTIWLLIESDGDKDLLVKYVDSSCQVIHIQKAAVIDGAYPDFYDRVIPKGDPSKNKLDVAFNAEYLAMPAKILQREGVKFSGQCILTTYGDRLAATIEIKRVCRECTKNCLLLCQ
ncbi:hypothetical protein Phi2_0058 [Vibrio phage phi 2]|uniref:RusA-like Holliday junction resolvase n=1 Tax=Vibrio phage X29 TaxID=1500713 RepID=UPI00045FC2DF|nr:RusA-like Holliday junction resolvase [Vibrio phage X29]AHN84867.1 hypothetical protein Phi2_0058 [Vibrio phage phi 2]AIA10291.1 DNA clamp protein [Vibrio phage X29]